ncbi:hypothetical protein EG329_011356 [Mollisiaceae sp. DMI_Dod_QoI]|nr:hypothetical protein EG329_011356 [Helotiales sp. DMI_Dod_QoI]
MMVSLKSDCGCGGVVGGAGHGQWQLHTHQGNLQGELRRTSYLQRHPSTFQLLRYGSTEGTEAMDPLSIAASVGSLSSACILTVKRLCDAAGKLRDAPKIVQEVSSEAKVIAISLSQLHNIFVNDEHTILAQALLTPDIRSALDIALTGCKVTLSCIENETRSLAGKISSEQKLNLADRAKVLWKDDKFKELLHQLHRQHSVIAILQQGLQMKALTEIVPLLNSNRAAIQSVADGTESLRGSYPQINSAKSFLESCESANGNEPSMSLISERQFEFDDLITDSQAYRRVLVAASQSLRNGRSRDVLADRKFDELGVNQGAVGKQSSDPVAQSANQARKINAAMPSRSAPQKDSQRPMSDPNNFVQQLRGYVDYVGHVERQFSISTDENLVLRETVDNMNNHIQDLKNDISLVRKGAEVDKLQLEKILAENEELGYENKAMLADIKRLESELGSMTSQLSKTTKERDELQDSLFSTKIQLYEELDTFASYHGDLENSCRLSRDECRKLEKEISNYENSLQKGGITQIGSMLFIPLQSPAYLDEQNKRPAIFEAISAPETLEGWIPKWDEQQKKWIFVNKYTNESQFQRPTAPAMNPRISSAIAKQETSKQEGEIPKQETSTYALDSPQVASPKALIKISSESDRIKVSKKEWRGKARVSRRTGSGSTKEEGILVRNS